MRWKLGASLVAGLVVLGALALALAYPRVLELLVLGEQRRLEPREPSRASDAPTLLIVALDGVGRDLLYGLVRRGEMPELAALLGAERREFPHAYFEPALLTVMPSSTMAAWASSFSGVPPSAHGVAGNEFFIRERNRFAAPAPVSVLDPSSVLAIYTDDYADALLAVPSFYERLHEHGKDISAWVSMSQFHAGADLLLMASRSVLATAFQAMLEPTLDDEELRELIAELDEEVIDTVDDTLARRPAPRVLTVYLAGTDLYAHRSRLGPESARTTYLTRVIDPAIGRLRRALASRDALSDRAVVVISDHGHTAVVADEAHALGSSSEHGPARVVREAGFRLRPFQLEVDADSDHQVVLAYGGATAYVYVADRSTCPRVGDACDWSAPPRFEQDVLPLTQAFWEANERGRGAPEMRGTLDLVLTRAPKRFDQPDDPFAVYVGGDQLVPLETYLREHPHPHYVEAASRLRELSAGPFGERAGDIMLLAHFGDREQPSERFYFAGVYHSWHGSPSRQDSEVPLIVAHPGRTTAELRTIVGSALGAAPRISDVMHLYGALLGVDLRR